MSINPALLITTNDLQQYLVDKETGAPLAAGVITLYKDNSRTFLKNWYYQSGTAPNYIYIPLPNPLVLSSVGTVVDVNGNDVLPFYYPFSETSPSTSETYYITVYNSQGQLQFTRQNFPFSGVTETPSAQIPTLKNLIVNNNFWRASGTPDSNGNFSNLLTNVTSTLSTGGIAPSSHDGFSMPDIQFFKSTTGAVETATVTKFPAGFTFPTTLNDPTPEFYLNHTCTSAGLETFKYYQWPIILHIKNLESETATFTIDAQSLGSLTSSVLQFGIYQFPGTTNNAPPTPVPIINGTFTLTPTWTKYNAIFQFPLSTGINISSTGDDAFYLIIFIPAGLICNINFTQPSIYLGTTVPTNNLQTYDQTDAIINSPRTGQQIETWSYFPMPGWVPTTNQTIGTVASTATFAGTPMWPLYNLLWNGTTQPVCPVNGGRGSSAYFDWNANKYMNLPSTLGYVSANLNVLITPKSYTSSGFVLTVPSGTSGYVLGSPVQVVGSSLGSLVANTIYYVTNITPTSIDLALTIELANMGSATPAGVGSGVIQNALGVAQGQSTTSEVPNHVHPFTANPPPVGGYMTNDGGPFGFATGGDAFNNNALPSGTTGTNINGVADISLYQPTTYINKFIKL